MPSTSDRIRARLLATGTPFLANNNIAEVVKPGEMDALEVEVAEKVADLLRALVIDVDNDHNTKDTAERVARMYLTEVFRGRYQQAPNVTDFPNAKQLDQVYSVGPITVRSTCSHHLVPILGKCWVGVKPGDRVIGLSKFTRLAEWVFSRPHIQEEAVMILADEIERLVAPVGLVVIVKAQHYCMKWRGVREPDTNMVTSVVRGEFRDKPHMKDEFLSLIQL
jgi:GTP cyclohydrolase I